MKERFFILNLQHARGRMSQKQRVKFYDEKLAECRDQCGPRSTLCPEHRRQADREFKAIMQELDNRAPLERRPFVESPL